MTHVDGVVDDVYAGVVGRMAVPTSRMFHLSRVQDPIELIYPFWVLRHGEGVTLVDIGFPSDIAAARGIGAYHDPLVALRDLGLDAAAIRTVVVSHLHFDHFTAPERFPNATFYLQQHDLDYFAGRGRSHPAAHICDEASVDAVVALRESDRLSLLDGSERIGPVTVELVGGHTPGSQIVSFEYRDAGPVVLAGDCSHFFANLQTRTPTSIIHEYEAYQHGFALITQAAAEGVWLPGHDPAMLELMDPVAPDVYRLRPGARPAPAS